MAHDPHHEHLVKDLTEIFEPIFSKSPQEWVENQYPVEDVAKEDQEKGIKAYMEASRKLKASTLSGTWVRKDGKKIKTEVTMVPISYKGEVFILHFISSKLIVLNQTF